MKPPFTTNGTGKKISLEILSFITAFWLHWLLVLEDQNLLPYPEHLTTWNLPFWLRGLNRRPSGWSSSSSQNQQPEIIPEPITFPGMAHFFSWWTWATPLPSQGSGLYFVRSADSAQEDSPEKLFVHFNTATQMFITHFRRWVAETIRRTYENSSASNLPRITAHDVRGISASFAYYLNTPLKELCRLIGWKSSNVFVRHYLRDMAADTKLQDIPLVAARTAFL